jgi:hypothetical protein
MAGYARARFTSHRDGNTKARLSHSKHRLFFRRRAEIIPRQLKSGSLVLLDIVAGKDVFRASISTKGYQVDLGKIHAQGFRFLSD